MTDKGEQEINLSTKNSKIQNYTQWLQLRNT